MPLNYLDISSTLGLIALITLTFNFLLGLLLSTGYKKSIIWHKLPFFIKKIHISRVHNWTAYLALVLILAHGLLLLFDRSTKFRWMNVLFPFSAPHQPFWVAMGVLSLYAVCIVLLTSQNKVRKKMGFRFWKNVHLISYFTALVMCLHGLFMDQELKDRMPDIFDGEKLISEISLVVLLIFSYLRIKVERRKKKVARKSVNPLAT